MSNVRQNEVIFMQRPAPKMYGKNERMSFAKIDESLAMPNLIEIQKNSYDWFMKKGLKDVFEDVSPISDHSGNLSLEFYDYYFDEHSKYTIEECKERDATYSVALRVKVPNWICSFPTRLTPVTPESPLSATKWPPKWAKAATIPKCSREWLSLN